ncbi:ATP-binding protein [Candidatus Acetothermia bacterium]|nr:ATP-binding protein [Candidatus Acetothermia bacterium]
MAEFDLEQELQRMRRVREKVLSEDALQTTAPPKRALAPEEIGHVAISDELYVSTTEHCIEVYIPEEKRNEVAVSEYVVIPLKYQPYKIFARLKKLSYRKRDAIDDMSEIHARLNLEQVSEDEYIEIAELEPISMVGTQDARPAEVRYLPKPNTIVRRVVDADEIKTGLDIPQSGLFLGYVSVNGERITVKSQLPIPYYLINDTSKTGDPLLFTHTLIAGMSGRGKTHTSKNFLRQVVGSKYKMERRSGAEREPCLVIIDPDNEYWGLKDENPNLSSDNEEIVNLKAVGGKCGGIDSRLNVFIANEEGKKYAGSDRYTNFTIPFELVQDFPYLIAGGELNEMQYDGLVRLVQEFFKTATAKTYAKFHQFVEDEGNTEKFLTTFGIHEGTLRAIRRRVSRSYFQKIFDQGANPLTKIYNEAFNEGAVSVFPTDHLSEEGERVVVLTIMSMVADAKTKAMDDREWGTQLGRIHVVLEVDEEHSYLTKSETAQDKIIVEKFIRDAKQGRKNRLGLVLITQNPQDVNDGVLSQISTKILLGMDSEMAEKVNAPKHYQKILPYFEKGRRVIHSPDNSHPLELRGLDFCVVRH